MSLIIRPDGSTRPIPFKLLRKQKTVEEVTTEGLAYWNLPGTLRVVPSYINTSADPVENWITRFFHDLQLSVITPDERDTYLQEESNSEDGSNWESDVRALFGSLSGEHGKGAPMFKSEQDFTYTYSFSHVHSHGVQGTTNTASIDMPLEQDLWEVNKDKIMAYLQMSLSRKWPIKSASQTSPSVNWSVQIGYQSEVGILMGLSSVMSRRAALYHVSPADPGYVKINGLAINVSNTNNVSSEVGILNVGHGDTNPELSSYDPADWSHDVYTGTAGTTINDLSVKNYFWMFVDLPSWQVWDPTTATGYVFLSEGKHTAASINSFPNFTRNVTVKSFLVPSYNASAKLLVWKMYVVEYEQGTSTVLKCWLATKYSRMSKYGSPCGVYTLRYMAGKKNGSWTCEDVTTKSNIKITVSVPLS